LRKANSVPLVSKVPGRNIFMRIPFLMVQRKYTHFSFVFGLKICIKERLSNLIANNRINTHAEILKELVSYDCPIQTDA